MGSRRMYGSNCTVVQESRHNSVAQDAHFLETLQSWRNHYAAQRRERTENVFIFGSYQRDVFMISWVFISFMLLIKDALKDLTVCAYWDVPGCTALSYFAFILGAVLLSSIIVKIYTNLQDQQQGRDSSCVRLKSHYDAHEILRSPTKNDRLHKDDLLSSEARFKNVQDVVSRIKSLSRDDSPSPSKIIVPIIDSNSSVASFSKYHHDGSIPNAFNTPKCDYYPSNYYWDSTKGKRSPIVPSSRTNESPFKLLENAYAFLPTVAPPNTPHHVRSRRRPSKLLKENLWDLMSIQEPEDGERVQQETLAAMDSRVFCPPILTSSFIRTTLSKNETEKRDSLPTTTLEFPPEDDEDNNSTSREQTQQLNVSSGIIRLAMPAKSLQKSSEHRYVLKLEGAQPGKSFSQEFQPAQKVHLHQQQQQQPLQKVGTSTESVRNVTGNSSASVRDLTLHKAQGALQSTSSAGEQEQEPPGLAPQKRRSKIPRPSSTVAKFTLQPNY